MILDDLRELERTGDPRVWPMRARIRWPKKLGASKVQLVRNNIPLDWVEILCGIWHMKHVDEVPSEDQLTRWMDWGLRVEARLAKEGSMQIPGEDILDLIE